MPRFNIYTSFQLTVSKCCDEILVDNVGDRVMIPEKVVISKKKERKFIIFLAVSSNVTPDQYE